MVGIRKIPRRGHTITDDFPPTQNIVVKDVLIPFSVDPILYDPSYYEWNYSVGFPMSWSGFTPVVTDQFTHSLYYKTGVNRFITSSLYGQFNPSQFLIGDELYVSTPLGPVALNYAMKQTTDIDGYGHSAQILYTTYPLYSSPINGPS